jgi:hypothetical protein
MIQSAIRNSQFAILRHAAAAVLFITFAYYLYHPHPATYQPWRWLLPLSAVLGALGMYALSRRWVAGFAGSCLAGAVYGFGPFMLGLARCHPSVSVVAASIPWLCAPPVFLGKQRHSVVGAPKRITSRLGNPLYLPLWLLPFAGIALYFWICASQRLFVAPIEFAPQKGIIAGFVAPLVSLTHGWVVVSVYHVAIAPLILGFAMMAAARRYSLFSLLAAGLVLAFSRPFLSSGQTAWLNSCPTLWLSLPMVSLALFAAVGLQGLIEAGSGDKKWLLIAAASQALLAIAMLLLATKYFEFAFGLANTHARLFVEEAKMYLLGMMAVTMVFLMAYRHFRLQWLRWLVLCTALSLDIFLSARYLIDKVL